MIEENTEYLETSSEARANALPLPALNFLGYSLDLSTVTPLDIGIVSNSVKRPIPAIDVNPNDRPFQVTIDGVTYSSPYAITVTNRTGTDQGFNTWTTGSAVDSAFQSNNTLYAKYGAISGSESSIRYSYQKSFLDIHQFGLFSQGAFVYSAVLRSDAHKLNEEDISRSIKRLPNPFRETDEHLRDYKNFFATFGTHVIVECQYGSRFQLNIHARNSDSVVNGRFNTNIRADYGGIMSNGQFDASVKSEAQFKRYEDMKSRTLSTHGGDAQLSLALQANPSSYPTFTSWVSTGRRNPNITSFGCKELWALVREAGDKDLAAFAEPLHDAFMYITTHPQVYRTAMSLTIESDWGEFELMTTSAICQINPNKLPEDPNLTTISEVRVKWGRELSHNYRRITIEFWLINDGSPIDFALSHGSNGSVPGNGKATATFAGRSYVSSGVTDNHRNTRYFYQAPVSGTPVYRHTPYHGAPKITWNDMLNEYLRKHRDGVFDGLDEGDQCVEVDSMLNVE